MGKMIVTKLFSSQAITQNTNVFSGILDLRNRTEGGNFGIYYTFAGAGNLKIEYFLAPTPQGTFLSPSGAVVVVAAGVAGSDVISFAPEVAPFLKLKLTEINVGAITGLDLWLSFV